MTIVILLFCVLLLTTEFNDLLHVLRHTTFVMRNAYGCLVNVRHKPLMLNVFIPLLGAIKHVACLQYNYCQ